MANPNTAHEPSMEEILASIRQIISEDAEPTPNARPEPKTSAPDAHPAESPPPKARSAPANQAHPVEPLASASPARHSDPMKAATAESPRSSTSQREASASRSAVAAEASPRPEGAHPDPADSGDSAPVPPRPADVPKLLSEQSKAAVSGAFGALAHTIFAQNARTLEDLVAEMLRPMLKGWLDDNLPSLVERLVREEIERVSRGRR